MTATIIGTNTTSTTTTVQVQQVLLLLLLLLQSANPDTSKSNPPIEPARAPSGITQHRQTSPTCFHLKG